MMEEQNQKNYSKQRRQFNVRKCAICSEPIRHWHKSEDVCNKCENQYSDELESYE